MATPDQAALSDVQGRRDDRAKYIEAAGVRRLRIPVQVTDRGGRVQHTVADMSMAVDVPADRKGAHMSRFVEVAQKGAASVSVTTLHDFARDMIKRLESTSGELSLTFPFFVFKAAPVSGEVGPIDYEATLKIRVDGTRAEAWTTVAVPATSLCPCSKEISDYSAHNQRSIITVSVIRFDDSDPVWIEDLIELAEAAASCPVYAVLKRVDEKFVTEAAYDNPKFVEDIVRDLAAPLDADERVARYVAEVENMESIHNHEAYARVHRDKRAEG